MYVCICRAVTDHQIREAVREGECCSMRDLQRCLGVGTQCGRCARDARELLLETLSESETTQAA